MLNFVTSLNLIKCRENLIKLNFMLKNIFLNVAIPLFCYNFVMFLKT
jgi:hypothetical protein